MSFFRRFIDFVKVFPAENWDWIEISRNINIKMKDIRDNMDLPWNWRYGVSSNPNLDLDMIRDFPYYDWDKSLISSFIPLNLEIIKLLDNRKEEKIKSEKVVRNIDWYPYSYRKHIFSKVNIFKKIHLEDIKCVKVYFNNIIYTGLSMNENINIRYVIDNIKKNWNWYYLSKNKAIKMEIFLKYEYYLPWNIKGISENPNINLNIVNRYKKKLDINSLVKNPSFKFEMIDIIGSDKNWDWKIISKHNNITKKIIMENIDRNWEILNFGENRNLDFEFIYKFIEIKKYKIPDYMKFRIDDFILSKFYCNDKNKYKNLSTSIISEYKYLNIWNWKFISEYVPMTTKFVFENQDRIDFKKLSKNNFCNNEKRKMKRLAYFQALNTKTKLCGDTIRNIIINYL